MSDEWEKYVKDIRTVCKYGLKCYQQNPEHHENYKHPPTTRNLKNNRNRHRFNPYERKDKPRANKDTAQSDGSKEIASKPATTKDDESTNSKEKDCNSDNKDDEAATSNVIEPALVTSKEYDVIISKEVDDKIFKEPVANFTKDITFYDSTKHEVLEELFLVEMPLDFYKFYECLNEKNDIDRVLSSVNLELIGPYDLLRGKLPIVDDKKQYLVHWRFFYDPPEFQVSLIQHWREIVIVVIRQFNKKS